MQKNLRRSWSSHRWLVLAGIALAVVIIVIAGILIFYSRDIPPGVQIYAITSDASHFSSTIHALQSSDGTELWHYKADGGVAKLTTDQNAVYFYTYGPAARAGFLSALPALHPFSARAISVYALRAKDGTVLWQHDTGSSNVSLVGADGSIYVSATNTSGTGTVTALRANDGRQLWQAHLPFPATGAIGLIADKIAVYVGSPAGTISGLSASDGHQLWHYDVPGGAAVIMGEADGIICAGIISKGVSNTVYALQASNGHLLWQQQVGFIQALEGADGNVYVSSIVSNEYELLALLARNAVVLWHYTTNLPLSYGGVANGKVYIATIHDISALNVSSGSVVWKRNFDNGTILMVSNDTVYVQSTFHDICAFRGVDGGQIWCSTLKG